MFIFFCGLFKLDEGSLIGLHQLLGGFDVHVHFAEWCCPLVASGECDFSKAQTMTWAKEDYSIVLGRIDIFVCPCCSGSRVCKTRMWSNKCFQKFPLWYSFRGFTHISIKFSSKLYGISFIPTSCLSGLSNNLLTLHFLFDFLVTFFIFLLNLQ